MSQSKCSCCLEADGYIAYVPRERRPAITFSELIAKVVCWECYVAVIHPVDRKLANAKARVSDVYHLKRPVYTNFRHDMRNIMAWEEAIANRKLQRELYGIEAETGDVPGLPKGTDEAEGGK